MSHNFNKATPRRVTVTDPSLCKAEGFKVNTEYDTHRLYIDDVVDDNGYNIYVPSPSSGLLVWLNSNQYTIANDGNN